MKSQSPLSSPLSMHGASLGVYRFGFAVAVFIVLVAGIYLWKDRQDTLDRDEARGELLTRILFNHVSRTLASSISIMTMANQWSSPSSPTQPQLKSAIENSSFIRSLSMLTEEGLVLSSSEDGMVRQVGATGIGAGCWTRFGRRSLAACTQFVRPESSRYQGQRHCYFALVDAHETRRWASR